MKHFVDRLGEKLMKKKILFLYPDYFIGGSTTSLINLLNIINTNKYDIYLGIKGNGLEFAKFIPNNITLITGLSKINRNGLLNKIKFIFIYIIKGYFFRSLITEICYNKKFHLNKQKLSKYSAKESREIDTEFDVAIGFFEYWANDYLNLKVKSNTKIAWVHTDYKKAQFRPKLDKKCFSNMDKIVTVSKDCKASIDSVFPHFIEKSIYIENIISRNEVVNKSLEEIEDFPISTKTLNLVTVSRLDMHTKGLDRIILTMKRVVEKNLNIRWYIIGDGPDRKKINNLIINQNLSEQIILLGAKANPFPYVKKSDLFVLPSRFEGKPMAVTESQIIGTPVLVTKYASSDDQINNYITGIIVENSEDSIYDELNKIYFDRSILQKIKNNLLSMTLSNYQEINKLYNIF